MRSSVFPSVFLLAALLAAPTAHGLSKTEQAIAERIAPVGKVCIEGDTTCATAPAPVSSGPRAASEVYDTVCMGCHTTGAAGAPKIGDADAWSARLGQGMESLVSNAINGMGAMPPRGACGNCSDEEIAAAVEYIIESSR